MQPAAVAGRSLDGVAEGVPEVEQRALARLALAGGHAPRLELAAAPNGVDQGGALPRQDPLDVLLEPGEEGRIEREAMLDDFGEPGAQLALRQGIEGSHVRDHRLRLVE